MAEHDVRITGGRIVSTFTGEEFAADVLLRGAMISGVVAPGTGGEAPETVDATGLLVVPGFVDAHMHIESSFLTPTGFAELTLARGTTTVLADPHEIVNVAGAAAMRWMVEAGRHTGQTQLWGVPSCVPAVAGLERSGAHLTAADIDELLELPGVIALGEVMDYRAVVSGETRMTDILRAARDRGVILDGHCPNLSGEELSDYLATGVDSDHTKNRTDVALEKARLGMLLMLQEKCLIPELIQALNELPQRPPLCLVTDDLAADHIRAEGHLDHIARVAVGAGLPPLEALRAITITPAQRLRQYDRGVVSPGKRADLVLLRGELAEFAPEVVLSGGRVVARSGRATRATTRGALPPLDTPMRVDTPTARDFRWPVSLDDGRYRFRAMRVNARDTYTEPAEVELPVRAGEVDWEGHTALIRVRNRYGGDGCTFAPVTGMRLSAGAICTTYAHDSHNLVTIGTTRAAMAAAAEAVIADGGGVAVVLGGDVVARLPLPIGGVMSAAEPHLVADQAQSIREALRSWGWVHLNPFMSVSTLTLPVSPSLKITDLSLVDVVRRAPVPSTL
jgi:adenine deaminase